MPSSQALSIDFGGEFRGGDATLSYIVTCEGVTTLQGDFNFEILGMNPTRTTLRTELPVLWLKVVAHQESFTTQFSDLGSNVSWTYYPGPLTVLRADDNGFGVMQITNGPLPSNRDLWNWRENVNNGEARLDVLIGHAAVYQNQVANGLSWDGHTGGEPPNEHVAYSPTAQAPDPLPEEGWTHQPDSNWRPFTARELHLEAWARYRTGYRYHNWEPTDEEEEFVGNWVRRASGSSPGPDYADIIQGYYEQVTNGSYPGGWGHTPGETYPE